MTDITADDEREAREWLAWAENRQKQNIGKYKYVENDDVRHRRTILALLDAVEASQRETRTVPDDVVLTLVSQARQRARDAALEEAAKVVEDHYWDTCSPEHGTFLAKTIRALRSKP